MELAGRTITLKRDEYELQRFRRVLKRPTRDCPGSSRRTASPDEASARKSNRIHHFDFASRHTATKIVRADDLLLINGRHKGLNGYFVKATISNERISGKTRLVSSQMINDSFKARYTKELRADGDQRWYEVMMSEH